MTQEGPDDVQVDRARPRRRRRAPGGRNAVTRCAAYRIKQDGMIVGRVEGADDYRVFLEILHYAGQYQADGPVQIQRRDPETGRWRFYDNLPGAETAVAAAVQHREV